jgi:hypothetical protein
MADGLDTPAGLSFTVSLKTKKIFCTNLKSNCINLRLDFIFILATPLLN